MAAMVWYLYNFLFAIGFLFFLPKALYRMWKRGGYRRDFAQRFGYYRRELAARLAENRGQWIWIHAVSVGEIYVALSLMTELRAKDPTAKFVLSTNTSTAYGIGKKNVRKPDALIYFPLDLPFVMRRILNIIAPRAVLLVECEIWPNFIRQNRARGVPVILVNGRISSNSYRGYRKLKFFTKRLLPQINLFCTQTNTDAQRLIDLGAPDEKVKILGSTKYDLPPMDNQKVTANGQLVAKLAPDRLILLGGSTWPGEEKILANAYASLRQSYPKLFLILVPRHVERRDEIAAELSSYNLLFRSKIDKDAPPTTTPDILVWDTTGDLRSLYPLADIIFVGNSLTHHGGQNIIEPGACGKPVIVGPNMENFVDIVATFRRERAVIEVKDGRWLEMAIEKLVSSGQERAEYGKRAAEVVRGHAGATARTAELVFEQLTR